MPPREELSNPMGSLYQELIIDHGTQPRNFGRLETPSTQAEGYNPLCGDHFHVYVNIQEGCIKEICFHGRGCAISTASASFMCELMQAKSLQDATQLFQQFQTMITSSTTCEEEWRSLGKLAALSGVRSYPMRIKCATLAWHTLQAALSNAMASAHSDNIMNTVTTE